MNTATTDLEHLKTIEQRLLRLSQLVSDFEDEDFNFY